NPFEVFPSTLLLYKKLFPYFQLQKPSPMDSRREFVFNIYNKMFEKLFKEKDLIPKGNLIEIKYEDFIQEPFNILREIYLKLNLSGFDSAEDNFDSYLETQKHFQINIHALDDDLRQEISHRWQMTIDKWGYN
ncbi:MAG: sulfotransferase, partial [Candidatus Heimdallarchaeota archaeon]